ncbi:MAG: site-2 protease family protein [Candidatus Omnitrophota bacterium]|nr:MAG: site-2 protease family protein [Candidatus Omnitrophota bacterium]
MNIPYFIVLFGLLMIAMSVHEFAHGWTAYRLGDTTAKYLGRLTLNPLAHIDPVGTVLLPLMLLIATNGQFVFGAAKPVPINYLALRNPKRDMVLIGLSGPLANLLFAVASSILLRFLPSHSGLSLVLYNLIFINVVLGIFNLVPIPPLDGSRIVAGILPRDLSERYASLEPYGFFIIIILLWLGVFDVFVWPVIRLIASLLANPF